LPLTSTVSGEKLAANHIVIALLRSYFSPAASKFFFVFIFQHVNYSMSGCKPLCVYPTWSLLSLLDVLINVFIKFGAFSAICPSNIYIFSVLLSLSVPSGPPPVHVRELYHTFL
jgi:hypothetical protein